MYPGVLFINGYVCPLHTLYSMLPAYALGRTARLQCPAADCVVCSAPGADLDFEDKLLTRRSSASLRALGQE